MDRRDADEINAVFNGIVDKFREVSEAFERVAQICNALSARITELEKAMAQRNRTW